MDKPSDSQSDTSEVQGEGDYRSARKFQKEEHAFARDDVRVRQGAQEAERALDGPEGEELERARQASAKGESLKR